MIQDPMFIVKFIFTYTILFIVVQFKLIFFPFQYLYLFSEYCIDHYIKF